MPVWGDVTFIFRLTLLSDYGLYQYHCTKQLELDIRKPDKTNQKILEVDPYIGNGGPVGESIFWNWCGGGQLIMRQQLKNRAKQKYSKTDLTCENSQFNLFNFVLAKSFSKLPNKYVTLREGFGSRTFLSEVEPIGPFEGTSHKCFTFLLGLGILGDCVKSSSCRSNCLAVVCFLIWWSLPKPEIRVK